MAHGKIKREQIDTEGAGNIATDMEVNQMVSSSFANPGHKGLSGLDNDDHIQYLLANGHREVDGSLIVNDDIYINYDHSNNDTFIYFGLLSPSPDFASLIWNTGGGGFIFSHKLSIHGNFESDDIQCAGNIGCNGSAIFNNYVRTQADFYADSGNGKGLVVRDKTTGILYRIIVDNGKVSCEAI